MAYQFNTPPGWPTPPPGWTPPDGWQPDPTWPPAPPGWQFWTETGAAYPGATAPYPAAPAPYSGEPTAQVPYAGVPAAGAALPAGAAAPVYAPGGYAAADGPPGSASTTPEETSSASKVWLLIGLVTLAVAVLGIGLFLLMRGLGSTDDAAPAPVPTTQAPTDPAPSAADPPSDDPTEAGTADQAEPTNPATGEPEASDDPAADPPASSPAGSVAIELGESVEIFNFSDVPEASVTVTEVQWDPACSSSFFSAENRYLALWFEVETTDADSGGYPLNGLFFQAYGADLATGESAGGLLGMFCDGPDRLPSTIPASSSASGWVIFDVPSDTEWIVYEPWLGSNPNPAWPVPAP